MRPYRPRFGTIVKSVVVVWLVIVGENVGPSGGEGGDHLLCRFLFFSDGDAGDGEAGRGLSTVWCESSVSGITTAASDSWER